MWSTLALTTVLTLGYSPSPLTTPSHAILPKSAISLHLISRFPALLLDFTAAMLQPPAIPLKVGG